MVILYYKIVDIKEELKKMNKQQCIKCQLVLPLTDFWTYKTNPPTPCNKCKTCYKNEIDPYDIKTILPILKEFNMPFIEDEWEGIKKRYPNKSSQWVEIYMSKMKLFSFRNFEYKHSEWLNSFKKG